MDKEQWFEQGDIIRLEKGMVVCTNIPAKYKNISHPFSTQPNWCTITIGQVFYHTPISKNQLVTKIYYHFCESFPYFSGVKIRDECISAFVDSLDLNFDPSDFDTSVLIGEYVVTNCLGSSSIGNQLSCKFFSCTKVDDPSISISIEQNKEFMEKFPNCKSVSHKN